LAGWQSDETAAVRELADAVWSELLVGYPPALGYFSDCPPVLDLLAWCGLPLVTYLDSLRTADALPPARHLADVVDAVFTVREPFESASKTTVLDWLKEPAVGDRLQGGFFAAHSDEAARQLSAAYELWTVCARK
jgi:hypothetical protein